MKLTLVDRVGDSVFEAGAFGEEAVWRSLPATLGLETWQADIVLVDDATIAELNQNYRGKPTATDVLSFSYLQDAGEGAPDLAAGLRGAACDLWLDPLEAMAASANEIEVGEILLAPEFIVRRCAENSWPVEHELPRLIVHGCLHLLGWDHEEDDERQAMQDIEEAVLKQEAMIHPLRQRR